MNKIVLTALLLIIATSLTIIAYFVSPLAKKTSVGNPDNEQAKVNISNQFPKNPGEVSPGFQTKGTLVIKGNKIYDGQTELFHNVPSYVKSVRLGPDGQTIHFQARPTDPFVFPAKCVDPRISIDFDPQSGPPLKAPWDFKMLHSVNSLRECHDRAKGFLDNSNQFAYLQIDKYNKGTLVVENIDNNSKVTISLPSEITSGFLDGNANTLTTNGTQALSVDDYTQERNVYLFPSHDTPLINNRLLLVFGGIVIGLNQSNNGYLTGFVPNTKKDADNLYIFSFRLVTDKTTPIAIRVFGWESVSNYQALYDYSTDKLLSLDLSKLVQPTYDVFGLRKIQWIGNSGVVINLYKENDINETEYKDVPREIKDINDEAEILLVEQRVEAAMKQKLSNPNVKCIFSPGIIGGCFSATNFTTYKYSLGSGSLQKL